METIPGSFESMDDASDIEGDDKEPHSSKASETVVYSAMRLDTQVSPDSAFLPVRLELPTPSAEKSSSKPLISSGSHFSTLEPRSDDVSTTLGLALSTTTLGLEIANILRDKSKEPFCPAPLKHLKKRASSSAVKAREILPLLPVLPPKPPCLPIKSFVMPLDELPPAKRVWNKPDFYRRRVRAPVVPLVNYHTEKRRLGGLDPLSYPYNAYPRVPQESGIAQPPTGMTKAVQDNVKVWSISTNTVRSTSEMKKLLRKLDKKTDGQTFSSARRCAVCHYAARKPVDEVPSYSQSLASLHTSSIPSAHSSLKTTLPLTFSKTSSSKFQEVKTSVDPLPLLNVPTKESAAKTSSVSVVSPSARSSSLLTLSERIKKSFSSSFTQTETISASSTTSQLDESSVPFTDDNLRLAIQGTSELAMRTPTSPDGKTFHKSNIGLDERVNSPDCEGDRIETPPAMNE